MEPFHAETKTWDEQAPPYASNDTLTSTIRDLDHRVAYVPSVRRHVYCEYLFPATVVTDIESTSLFHFSNTNAVAETVSRNSSIMTKLKLVLETEDTYLQVVQASDTAQPPLLPASTYPSPPQLPGALTLSAMSGFALAASSSSTAFE